ncbi:MAG: hypothetical protein ABEJ68_07380 [Halobacteriaceae archaeon]
MDVRDAVEEDAAAMADLTGLPTAAARELLHDRSVRVAVHEDEVVGVVAFDARPDVVHVTRLSGDPDVLPGLLAEPIRFAKREGMAVELVVPAGDPAADVAADEGFEDAGAGPQFEGTRTRRFRLDPA